MRELLAKLPKKTLVGMLAAVLMSAAGWAGYAVKAHVRTDAKQDVSITEITKGLAVTAASIEGLRQITVQQSEDLREMRAELHDQTMRTERVLARVERQLDKRPDVR